MNVTYRPSVNESSSLIHRRARRCHVLHTKAEKTRCVTTRLLPHSFRLSFVAVQQSCRESAVDKLILKLHVHSLSQQQKHLPSHTPQVPALKPRCLSDVVIQAYECELRPEELHTPSNTSNENSSEFHGVYLTSTSLLTLSDTTPTWRMGEKDFQHCC